MKENRRTRRDFLLGTTAALTALSGCIGGGDDSGAGGSGATGETTPTRTATGTAEPTPTSTSTPTVTATAEPTPMSTPTPTATAAPSTTASAAGVCAPWGGAVTPYDTADTPFVFSYDHVETWTPGEVTSYSRGHLQRLTSPAVGDADFSLTMRISQTSSNPLTAAERDEEVDYWLNFENEPRVVVDEITYDGERLRVLGIADEETLFYRPGLTVFLPHGRGEDRRYYPVGVATFDGLGVDESEREACIAAVEAGQWTTISSLEPNPETTFDGA